MPSELKSPKAPKPYEPPTCIYVSKAEASKFKVGKKAKLTIEGTVVSIRQDYDEKDRYSLELRPSKVVESEVNSADMEYDRMTKKRGD